MIYHKAKMFGNKSPVASGPAKHNSVNREENGEGAAKGGPVKVTKNRTTSGPGAVATNSTSKGGAYGNMGGKNMSY